MFLAAYLVWRLLIDFLKPQPLVSGLNAIQWACCAGLVCVVLGALTGAPVRRSERRRRPMLDPRFGFRTGWFERALTVCAPGCCWGWGCAEA